MMLELSVLGIFLKNAYGVCVVIRDDQEKVNVVMCDSK